MNLNKFYQYNFFFISFISRLRRSQSQIIESMVAGSFLLLLIYLLCYTRKHTIFPVA